MSAAGPFPDAPRHELGDSTIHNFASMTAPFPKDIVMNNEKKTIFAFKLAEKKDKTATKKWKARDGVSVAGCSDLTGDGEFRERTISPRGDFGVFC